MLLQARRAAHALSAVLISLAGVERHGSANIIALDKPE